jgi:biopolymer transport protein ExbD/biopolymer transport protein TolR
LGHGIRKLRKVGTGSRPNSDINITPMVDVVLVLLIIFMVVTPLLEKDIEVRVPDTEQTDAPEDVPAGQIVVAVSAAGELSVNMERLSEEEYEAKLKRVLAAKPKGERLVFFMPDENANYGVVVRALDLAKAAGAEILGMMTTELPVASGVAASAAPLPPPGP